MQHLATAVACLALLGLRRALYAQSNQSRTRNVGTETERAAPGEIQILPVQGNVWVLIGAGGNITVQAGDEGILWWTRERPR